MRINVYNEELTDEVEFCKKPAKTGAQFYALSFYLASPDVLHHTPEDDDRSAVIFWGDSPKKLLDLLSEASEKIKSYAESK
jgi:hypothetical protein